MIWFTSDSHFGHKNIINYGGRPFANIDEHDQALIKEWNRVVGPKDIVYHLGDFTLCNKARRAECFYALNGNKCFIQGNHDDGLEEFVKASGVAAWLGRMHTFKMDKFRAELCHFPLEIWDRKHHGAYHLHGHSHNNCNTQPTWRRLDVGVDSAAKLLGAYRPFSWDEIKAVMESRTDWDSADHHKKGRA